jgi:hypothetical protein
MDDTLIKQISYENMCMQIYILGLGEIDVWDSNPNYENLLEAVQRSYDKAQLVYLRKGNNNGTSSPLGRYNYLLIQQGRAIPIIDQKGAYALLRQKQGEVFDREKSGWEN